MDLDKNNNKHMMKKINKTEYPTLATYPFETIQTAVEKLQARYPDMTEHQCLLNLEMDLEEKALLAKEK